MVTKLTKFACLSTRAILPTSFAPIFARVFFDFSNAVIHIFLAPVIITTGVSFNTAFTAESFKIELNGILGERNHAWYPRITRSYLFSFSWKGASAVGTLRTQSGMTAKNVFPFQGKG